MTFNGCQGLMQKKTVLDLRTDSFAHIQLYTAVSAVCCRRGIRALFGAENEEETTANVVYRRSLIVMSGKGRLNLLAFEICHFCVTPHSEAHHKSLPSSPELSDPISHVRLTNLMRFTSALILTVVAASASSISATTIDANPDQCPVFCWGKDGCSKCPRDFCVSISSFGFDDMTHLSHDSFGVFSA